MAARFYSNGLYQIANSCISHAQLVPKSNHYYWTKTTNTTTVWDQGLIQQIDDLKKQINRQVYGDFPVVTGDHMIRKGIRDLSGADYSKLLPNP